MGITSRVPITVVVALTGEHLGFVMLDLFSVRFCSGNDGRDILCWPSGCVRGRFVVADITADGPDQILFVLIFDR